MVLFRERFVACLQFVDRKRPGEAESCQRFAQFRRGDGLPPHVSRVRIRDASAHAGDRAAAPRRSSRPEAAERPCRALPAGVGTNCASISPGAHAFVEIPRRIVGADMLKAEPPIIGQRVARFRRPVFAGRAAAGHVTGTARRTRIGRVGPGSRGASGHRSDYVRAVAPPLQRGICVRTGSATIEPQWQRAERIAALLEQHFKPTRLQVVDESALHAGHAGAAAGGETHYRRNDGLRRVPRPESCGPIADRACAARAGVDERECMRFALTCYAPEEDAGPVHAALIRATNRSNYLFCYAAGRVYTRIRPDCYHRDSVERIA